MAPESGNPLRDSDMHKNKNLERLAWIRFNATWFGAWFDYRRTRDAIQRRPNSDRMAMTTTTRPTR
jgi:hypothetical protein